MGCRVVLFLVTNEREICAVLEKWQSVREVEARKT